MKIDKSKLMKTAWEIAKEAAEKYNDSVRNFFAESLKQAWEMIKNNTLLDQVKNYAGVASFSDWKKHGHNRVYFNLKGYDKSFRGCRNFKLYYDNDTKKLHMNEGKGIQAPEFKQLAFDLFNDFEENIVYSN